MEKRGGLPPRLQSSLWRLLIARQRRLQETSGRPHAPDPPNVHLHATDPPTVRPPSDYLYTADFQNVRLYGAGQTP